MALKVLTVFGTRPEAIKMAPVVQALANEGDIEAAVCVTAQHRGMLDQVLAAFDIRPDYDLDLMRAGQDLTDITTRVLTGMRGVLEKAEPDWVLVHGDTTTALAAALAAFYGRVKIGHVEAGLRTYDLRRPWPEEMNRVVVDRVADLMFAPTSGSRNNLLAEGADPAKVIVTGNTVIDALLAARARAKAASSDYVSRFDFIDTSKRVVLVTGHRRESFGEGFRSICRGINRIAERGDTQIVYPVHLNPNVRGPVEELLSDHPNIHLIEPQEYLPFVWLMERADIILTDSGGVQEEAPSLGKPVLVMRQVTERPEAIAAGTVLLVGTDEDKIAGEVASLLDNSQRYANISQAVNPYGDGRAASRIACALRGDSVAPFTG